MAQCAVRRKPLWRAQMAYPTIALGDTASTLSFCLLMLARSVSESAVVTQLFCFAVFTVFLYCFHCLPFTVFTFFVLPLMLARFVSAYAVACNTSLGSQSNSYLPVVDPVNQSSCALRTKASAFTFYWRMICICFMSENLYFLSKY